MMLTIAYSPCPNDTFMFHDLAAGRLTLKGESIDIHLHDVETLNQLALKSTYDVTKVSFHTYLMIKHNYSLLKVGSALGFSCGPLVVSRKKLSPSDLPHCRIAIPGQLTTAHLLFKLWAPQAEHRFFVPYDQIISLVSRGEADCGVLIHESRFVYKNYGLHCLVDLGAYWEEETHLPIPLGGIVIKNSLAKNLLPEFEQLLQKSIVSAQKNPELTWEYVRTHAQELDLDTLKKHVQMFVNEFSLDLGDLGQRAVLKLEELARQKGVLE